MQLQVHVGKSTQSEDVDGSQGKDRRQEVLQQINTLTTRIQSEEFKTLKGPNGETQTTILNKLDSLRENLLSQIPFEFELPSCETDDDPMEMLTTKEVETSTQTSKKREDWTSKTPDGQVIDKWSLKLLDIEKDIITLTQVDVQ